MYIKMTVKQSILQMIYLLRKTRGTFGNSARLDDETEADPPYDRLYIEYVLAKMALYQHDYDAYSAHMTQYNNLYSEYKKIIKPEIP